jgi:hypothetical protein
MKKSLSHPKDCIYDLKLQTKKNITRNCNFPLFFRLYEIDIMKITLKIKIHKVMKKLLLITSLCAAVFQFVI